MRHCIAALFFFLFLLSYCAADGGLMPMPDYRDSVFMPEQKAVIIWDGQTEQLVLESKITAEDIANVAWLIPVESSTKPIVEAADEEIFFRLADLFRPKPKSTDVDFFGAAREGHQGVEVVEQLKVDIYDITILRATDETALINWLNQNGYSFPEAFPNLLSDYVRSGNIYFIANKINLQNRYPGLVVTSQDFKCAQEISEQRYFGYGGFAEERIEDYIYGPNCENANPEAVAPLVSLRLGIATPLKISFTPSKPFYPMLLSSVNLGKGSARLYFVGKQPYADSSGLFSTENMLQISHNALSEHGINQGDTVTLLSWEGNYNTLRKDSFFASVPFDPILDPNYVPPWEIILGVLSIILISLIILFFVSVPLIIVPFLLGFVVSWVLAQKKRKKSFFAECSGLMALIAAALLILAGPLFFALVFVLPSFVLFSSNIFENLFITSIFFLPYYASMVGGFFFKKSGYRLRFLFIPIAVFALLVLLVLLVGPTPLIF